MPLSVTSPLRPTETAIAVYGGFDAVNEKDPLAPVPVKTLTPEESRMVSEEIANPAL